jgi:hypothetical protein
MLVCQDVRLGKFKLIDQTACRLAWRHSYCCCRGFCQDKFIDTCANIPCRKNGKACQNQQTPISDESRFIILVSPLKYDPDGSHTDSKDIQIAEEETRKRAWDLIKAKHADLLLFGEVRERGKAVKIYAVNEHGGCDLHPKPTLIEHGDLPNDFNAEEKKRLIAVSLEEIAAGCLNKAPFDWSLFAKRIIKMEKYLTNLPSLESEDPVLFGSYADGMFLLYSNDQDDNWFLKDKSSLLRVIDQLQSRGNDKSLSLMWGSVTESY